MTAPLVSIVVPVYNAALYVIETVESLLRQTYKPLEIILIDDGSTDGSLALIQRYAHDCQVLSQPNQGQAATLNRGWAIARGSLLGYLSADDTLEPDAVGCMVEALETDPGAALAYPDYWLIDEQSRRFQDVTAPAFDHADMLLNGICPVGPGMLFRRTAYARAGGWNPQLRQIPDYEFLLRIGLQGAGLRVPRRLAGFRVHKGSQTFAVADTPRVMEHAQVIASFYARDDISPAYRAARGQALANAAVLMSRAHLRGGRYAAALASFASALSTHPPVLLRVRTWRLLANGVLGQALHRWRTRAAKPSRP
jgi:glycosyltransferase involved in cell wall biosynthesis